MRASLHTRLAVSLALLAAVPARVAAEGIPACGPGQRDAPHVSGLAVEQHRRFEVPVADVPAGAPRDPLARDAFQLRVDASGRVVCAVEHDSRPFRPFTAQERALLREGHGWRYAPFLFKERPATVNVTQRFFWQVLPNENVPAPEVPLHQVAITFVQGPNFFGGRAYAVHIRGDGWVGFHSIAGTDVEGTYAYRVPVAEVADLVELIRTGGFWSAAETYRGDVSDHSTQWLTVRFGPHTRRVRDYAGRAMGMPAIVTRVQEAASRVARAYQWISLSDAALDRLEQDRFDFRSPAGGKLLARAIVNRWTRDDRPMLRLLTLGAPIDQRVRGLSRVESWAHASMFENALRLRRTRLIAPMIARGALLTDGELDRGKIDGAFRAAISGGRLASVRAVWDAAGAGARPALTYRREAEPGEVPSKGAVPVTLLLSRDWDDDEWEGLEIARWLESKGVDLTGRDSGKDLLHIAAGDVDAEFVRFLIAKGVDATTAKRGGYLPIESASQEDVALALLDARSPLGRPMFGSYRAEAVDRGWTRVVAWLDAHPRTRVRASTTDENEREARARRVRRNLASPCWQRWIADQAQAIRDAKASGRAVRDVPMTCLCDDPAGLAGASVGRGTPSPTCRGG